MSASPVHVSYLSLPLAKIYFCSKGLMAFVCALDDLPVSWHMDYDLDLPTVFLNNYFLYPYQDGLGFMVIAVASTVLQ